MVITWSTKVHLLEGHLLTGRDNKNSVLQNYRGMENDLALMLMNADKTEM